MNIVIKFLFTVCLVVVTLSICVTIAHFYQTNRVFMFFSGVIALLFLLSMLYNAILVLFVRGV